MICEKCGKNNRTGAEQCASCGAEMPTVPYGTGFADILSFSRQQSGGPAEAAAQASATEVQELKKRLGESQERVRRQTIRLRIVTILAALFLILSVILMIGLLKKPGTEEQRDTSPGSTVIEPADKPDDKTPTVDDSPEPPDGEPVIGKSGDENGGNGDEDGSTGDKDNPRVTNPTTPTTPEVLPPDPNGKQDPTLEKPDVPEESTTQNTDGNDTNIV